MERGHVSPAYDLVLRRVDIATMREGAGYGLVTDGAIAVRGDRIAWIGPDASLPAEAAQAPTLALDGHLVTPGLVDCHTHLVYAGNRAHEFEQRLEGATYAAIARAGGGILGTVRATRAATEDELVAASWPRLAALAGQPVDCVVDAAIFGPVRQPVRDVMSGGRWIVRDGRHPEEEQVARRYREVLASVRWNGGM